MPGLIDKFQNAYKNANHNLRELHSQGRKIVGYFCTYTPVELLKACGFLPVRITGGRGAAEQCYNYLPEFICPFMKRSLEKALNGDYDFLSGIVQSYTCDAVCGCQAVWKNNLPGMSLHSFALPYNDSPHARQFYAEEFQCFIKDQGQAYDDAFRDVLWRAIDQYRNIRELILEIDGLRRTGFLPVSAEGMWYVVQAGFLLPPASYLKMLKELAGRKVDKPVLPDGPLPVIVSGSEIGHPDVLRYIEQKGGRIVWDDHCTGLRSVEPADGSGDDPLEWLADRYMRRIPCASRSRAEDRWCGWEDRLQQGKVRGVVFLLQKFCTPHLSDIPYFKEQLRKKEIPAIVIEMDEGWEVSGQVRTRIDGFMDMMQARNG